ncbi:MAG TPA: lyase family protein [bacterium]|nr:lyase family protein [bacterium]
MLDAHGSRDPVYVRHVLGPRYVFACREEFPYLRDVLVAHVVMLARQRLLEPAVAAETLLALESVSAADLPAYDPRWEDLYFVLHHRVDTATHGRGEFRLALSRNDAGAAVARLMLRDQTLDVIAASDGVREALLEQAERHRATLIMANTHHQHAQPTTAGHYLLAAAGSLGRCAERYRAALRRFDQSPLGAVALTTTGFAIDRHYTAALLGFEGVVENSYDAVSAGDYACDLAGCGAVLAASVSRVVYDLLYWAGSEVDGLRLSPPFIQISSLMPQKRNPVALEHVRSALSRFLGDCAAVVASSHNVPYGDVNDPVEDALPAVTESHRELCGTLDLLRSVVAQAEIRPEAWAGALRGTFATSTELADTLVRTAGLRFADAHAVAARLIADRRARGADFGGVTPEEVAAAAESEAGRRVLLSREVLEAALDPAAFVAVRNVEGGPGPRAMEAMLRAARAALAESRASTQAARGRVAAARAQREEAGAAVIAAALGSGNAGRRP